MKYDLKIAPEFFNVQLLGLKNFEIRKDDHEKKFKVGDVIRLSEYDAKNSRYTGRELIRIITFITSYEQKPGYVVFGTRPAEQ